MFLFSTIGRWIINLNRKLRNRILKLKKDEDKWKQGIREKFEEDVAMILDKPEEPEIENQIPFVVEGKTMYAKRWIQPEQEQDDDRPVCAPWLGEPK